MSRRRDTEAPVESVADEGDIDVGQLAAPTEGGDRLHQLRGVTGLGDHLVPGCGHEPGQPLTQEGGVVSEHDPHARILPRPRAGRGHATLP